MVTLFRRGVVWWVRYSSGGRQVRESLKTSNRKMADELRLRLEVELARQRLGLRVEAPAVQGVAPSVAVLPGAAVAVLEPPPQAAPSKVEPSKVVPLNVEPAELDLATIRQHYEEWSAAHKRPKTILNDKGRLEVFFATVPGKMLAAITTADVERLLTALARKGRSPATLLRHREILHGFWRWAMRQGHVSTNVVAPIPRPRLPERDPRFLSLEQIDELLAAVAGDRIAPLVATAVYAGLRREELCWLTWADVELDREPGILRVRAKTVGEESWQPKTKRDRKVPISSRLRRALQDLRDARGAKPTGWLFLSPEGCRWDPDNLSRRLRELRAKAELPWNLLDLRHTFGSQLARKGVSLLKIAKLMGNSPAIAGRHYINLVPEEMGSDVEF